MPVKCHVPSDDALPDRYYLFYFYLLVDRLPTSPPVKKPAMSVSLGKRGGLISCRPYTPLLLRFSSDYSSRRARWAIDKLYVMDDLKQIVNRIIDWLVNCITVFCMISTPTLVGLCVLRVFTFFYSLDQLLIKYVDVQWCTGIADGMPDMLVCSAWR